MADNNKKWNSQKIDDTLGKVSSVLGGLTGVVSGMKQAAQLGDVSQQDNMIDSMSDIGSGNYDSYSQIMTDYSRLGEMSPDLSYDTIRGGSTGQRIGNVGSSALSGAMAGLKVGGAWGALAGGIIGLGAGIGGWISGDAKAHYRQGLMQARANNANDIAQANMLAATDAYKDSAFRNSYASRMAMGGRIERKPMTVTDFADAVMGRQKASDRTHSAGISRRYVKGGLMVRIKK